MHKWCLLNGANGVANDALFAKWCLLECIGFVKTPDIISGCHNMGFRLNVPPLYSAVSLMATAWGQPN